MQIQRENLIFSRYSGISRHAAVCDRPGQAARQRGKLECLQQSSQHYPRLPRFDARRPVCVVQLAVPDKRCVPALTPHPPRLAARALAGHAALVAAPLSRGRSDASRCSEILQLPPSRATLCLTDAGLLTHVLSLSCPGMNTISVPNPSMYGPGDAVYTNQSVVYRQREPQVL